MIFAKINGVVFIFASHEFTWFLTPRCRTLKVRKVGIFSPYLRLATFYGFKMSSLNYMSLRNFEFFSFFLEILCFFVPHYTRQILKKCDAKRNDHVFPKLNEPSWFLQIFLWENNIFHIFNFLFPDWYIDEAIHNLISKCLCLFPDW